jgi:ABC-2 type transport system permease protein
MDTGRSADLVAILQLAKRSVFATYRQPAMIFPSLFFPLMFAALNSAAMARSINLPGFPKVDSFLDFMMATTIVQGVLFGSTSGGNLMAVDIQDGFFDRLVASPVARWAILLGRLAGAAALGAVQAVFFMAVLMAFGASVKGGVASVVAILVIAAVLGVGLGGMAVALALRTGSAEAVQAAFPVFFISLFFSSAFFPRQLMSGWFKTVAGINPMSSMIEAVRRLIIEGFSFGDAFQGLAIAALLGVASIGLSGLALRRRISGVAV